MSMKKATPKAVFDACEQLELLGNSWNRDDVRALVGGGSFVVIDPLIQSWRKLQPVREVAPTVPSELLIQIATMLEQQVSGYVEEVNQRDQAREEILLTLNKTSAENFCQAEAALNERLEQTQLANHDLEAELVRLESELGDKNQELQALTLKLQVAGEAQISLNNRLQEQKAFYESALKEQKQSQSDAVARQSELHQQQVERLQSEAKQQLAEQRAELIGSAEVAENRLLRQLDQSRGELKDLTSESTRKVDTLNHDLQREKQRAGVQKIEIKSLEGQLAQYELNAKGTQAQALAENEALRQELARLKSATFVQEKNDLQQLQESIRLLQEQVTSSVKK